MSKKNELLSREEIENVLVAALEGGSNYWYFLDEDGCKAIRDVVSKEEDRYLSTSITKAVLDHNASVPFRDVEDPEEILGYLSKESIEKGIQKAIDDNCDVLWNVKKGQDDAYDADVLLQYFLLGEVVFG